MEAFEKPIRRVWMRMRIQRFLTVLVWSALACFGLAVLAITLDKLIPSLPALGWWPVLVASIVAPTLAVVWAFWGGPGRLDAVVAIDQTYELDERLTTALTLDDETRASPAGRAVVRDALRRLEAIDVTEAFGFQSPRLAWAPVVPALLAIGLILLPLEVLPESQRAEAETAALSEEEKAAIIEPTKALAEAAKKERDQLDSEEYAETTELLDELAKVSDEVSKTPQSKEKALSKLNNISDALEERRRQLPMDQINRQLQQLQQLASEGPADRFSRDLARSDFQAAAEELQKLREKMARGEMTDQDRKQLAKQMTEMKKQLQELANFEKRREQLEQARQNGGISEQEYQREMRKLEDQAQNMQAMQQMAQQMAQAQQALANGDMAQANQSMNEMQQQLEQMAGDMMELESLDAALADLQITKDMMNSALSMNQVGERIGPGGRFGMGQGFGDQPNGMGMGRGRGQGDRPEAPTDTNSVDSRVRLQYGRGKAIVEGTAPPSGIVPGQSVIDIQGQINEAATERSADALTNQKVPGYVKDHIKGYFERLNNQGNP